MRSIKQKPTKAASTPPCPFLDLPAELRNQIYEMVFYSKENASASAILRTCKSITYEATGIFIRCRAIPVEITEKGLQCSSWPSPGFRGYQEWDRDYHWPDFLGTVHSIRLCYAGFDSVAMTDWCCIARMDDRSYRESRIENLFRSLCEFLALTCRIRYLEIDVSKWPRNARDKLTLPDLYPARLLERKGFEMVVINAGRPTGLISDPETGVARNARSPAEAREHMYRTIQNLDPVNFNEVMKEIMDKRATTNLETDRNIHTADLTLQDFTSDGQDVFLRDFENIVMQKVFYRPNAWFRERPFPRQVLVKYKAVAYAGIELRTTLREANDAAKELAAAQLKAQTAARNLAAAQPKKRTAASKSEGWGAQGWCCWTRRRKEQAGPQASLLDCDLANDLLKSNKPEVQNSLPIK